MTLQLFAFIKTQQYSFPFFIIIVHYLKTINLIIVVMTIDIQALQRKRKWQNLVGQKNQRGQRDAYTCLISKTLILTEKFGRMPEMYLFFCLLETGNIAHYKLLASLTVYIVIFSHVMHIFYFFIFHLVHKVHIKVSIKYELHKAYNTLNRIYYVSKTRTWNLWLSS